MGVPATTGQLRSSIRDMEIGDYIVCDYSAVSGGVGSFGNLGGAVTTEIPVTGAAVPNGSFYFIKVDNGLMVADRVVQHTISWDALNRGKYIEGVNSPISITPVMQSYTEPSGIVTQSSIFGAGWDGWKVFNGYTPPAGTSVNNRWASLNTGAPQWVAYDFQKPVLVRSYYISANHQAGADQVAQSPRTWRLEGSNDGAVWTIIDRQENVPQWKSSEGREFVTNNTKMFSQYRLYVESNFGNTVVSVSELRLIGDDSLIGGRVRSLTGGVAYSDQNGERSLTTQVYGGWPPNNEWERYIVNFSPDRVQPGKAIRDVFNTGQIATFVQDTTLLGLRRIQNDGTVGITGYRVIRGDSLQHPTTIGQGANHLNFINALTQYDYAGFRPVFEYREVE